MIVLFAIVTLIASALAFFVRKQEINHGIVIFFTLCSIAFNFYEYLHIDEVQLNMVKPDALGLIFLVIISVLGFFTAIHYRTYANKKKETDRTVSIHNSVYILFLAALAGVNLSNNFGLMWAFIEGTTLTGAVLIYHDRDKLALEAVWKYVFVCSVSITLAFAGILFLSVAAQGTNSVDFQFDSIRALAEQMNPIWLKASFLFILTGFSVKMGVFPMFNVDIDAKDMSPSPIGALFSSVLLNAGFLAIFRFYAAFSGTSIQGWMHNVLIITGVLSILFSAAYLIRVKNYKRILAYSSMEHAGLILLAVAMGKAGYVAALLHIIFHSMVKSSLFYQIDQVHRFFQSKMDGLAGGYFYKNPVGGFVLILALLSVVALPPSGLFISEFLIFKSFISTGHIGLSIGVMLLLTLIMFNLSKSIFRLLFIVPKGVEAPQISSVSPWESGSQLILLAASIYLGMVRPDFFMGFIEQALQIIP